MKKTLACILLMLLTQAGWALDIQEAKERGLVGEAVSGYVAAVKTPASAEVRALIAGVNARRRAEFERTAAKTRATVEQVSYRFYELAVQRTARGHYYQDREGRWVKK